MTYVGDSQDTISYNEVDGITSKIKLIKVARGAYGIGLKDAKDCVERFMADCKAHVSTPDNLRRKISVELNRAVPDYRKIAEWAYDIHNALNPF